MKQNMKLCFRCAGLMEENFKIERVSEDLKSNCKCEHCKKRSFCAVYEIQGVKK